jgi:hypothetical protein
MNIILKRSQEETPRNRDYRNSKSVRNGIMTVGENAEQTSISEV